MKDKINKGNFNESCVIYTKMHSMIYTRITVFLIMALLLLSACRRGSKPGRGDLEKSYRAMGLVNIHDTDPSILVDLIYTTENNFMGEDLYGNLTACYLQKEAAQKLKKAHDLLKKENPRCRLIVYDCARPNSVQWKMWDMVKETSQKNYVASPKFGSNHNFGAAVDLSIAEESGLLIKRYRPLDMGTPVDHLGLLAEVRHEERHLLEGKLSTRQVQNRRILREVMLKAGFRIVPNEWWHFNAFSTAEIRKIYRMIK